MRIVSLSCSVFQVFAAHDAHNRPSTAARTSTNAIMTTRDMTCLRIELLIEPLTVEEFIREYWGKKPFIGKMSDATLSLVKEGFFEADFTEVLKQCRRDDNSLYSSEEIEKMESDLEQKQTVDQQLCCTSAADALRNSFIRCCTGLGSHIAVGVYFSETGGEPTHWHFDDNHNINIQVTGQKEWQCIPPTTSGAISSRPSHQDLLLRPSNRFEQRSINDIPGMNNNPNMRTYVMEPGSVIYVPPGYWHTVASVGMERSFSTVLWVRSVLHSKWIAEAVFAGLLDRFHKRVSFASSNRSSINHKDAITSINNSSIRPSDMRNNPETSTALTEQALYVSANIGMMLHKCKWLRPMPSEERYTNGLQKGASLKFLIEQGFCNDLSNSSSLDYVGVNPIVSIRLKELNGYTMVVEIFSESSFSSTTYMWFSLYCSINLKCVLGRLIDSADDTTFSDLFSVDVRKVEAEQLLGVLLHANVLYHYEARDLAPTTQRNRDAASPNAFKCCNDRAVIEKRNVKQTATDLPILPPTRKRRPTMDTERTQDTTRKWISRAIPTSDMTTTRSKAKTNHEFPRRLRSNPEDRILSGTGNSRHMVDRLLDALANKLVEDEMPPTPKAQTHKSLSIP